MLYIRYTASCTGLASTNGVVSVVGIVVADDGGIVVADDGGI